MATCALEVLAAQPVKHLKCLQCGSSCSAVRCYNNRVGLFSAEVCTILHSPPSLWTLCMWMSIYGHVLIMDVFLVTLSFHRELKKSLVVYLLFCHLLFEMSSEIKIILYEAVEWMNLMKNILQSRNAFYERGGHRISVICRNSSLRNHFICRICTRSHRRPWTTPEVLRVSRHSRESGQSPASSDRDH